MIAGTRVSQIVSDILALDSRIRFVVLCNTDGKLLSSAGREGKESIEPEEVTKLFLAQAAIGTGMAHSADGYHGPLRMVIIQRERLMHILFNKAFGMVLISAEPDLPLEKAGRLGRVVDSVESGSRQVSSHQEWNQGVSGEA